MEVTLVRHGQSEHNAGLTDFLDSGLTPLGRLQAEKTAARLKNESIEFGLVSPLRRTLETMAPIAEVGAFPVRVEPLLSEYFSTRLYLSFPGMLPQTIRDKFPYAAIPETISLTEPWWMRDIEGPQDIYARCVRLRDSLMGIAHDYNHILLVSHAETIGRFIEAAQHLPPNLEGPPWTDNCGICRLSFVEGLDKPAIVRYINDTWHLK